jgi:hypothetical protein
VELRTKLLLKIWLVAAATPQRTEEVSLISRVNAIRINKVMYSTSTAWAAGPRTSTSDS